jgi:tRNA threonylcarbamoyladenosine biosynthesis protein TsaB
VLTLALETSSLAGSVALLADDHLLAQQSLAAGRSTQTLAPAIDRLLKDAGLRPADLNLVAVTIGPGSFTGLRIGVTTAKTLAYAVGAQVLGLDTLEVIACQAPRESRELHVVLDAQRKELFLARFRWEEDQLVRLDESRIVAAETWLAELQPGSIVTGPGLARLEDRLPTRVQTVDLALRQPAAEAVGRLALRHYREGRRDDLWKLAPQYLRASAAEEKAGQVSNQVPKLPTKM